MDTEKQEQAQAKGGVGRRGVIAGAAALAAALIAKQTSAPVEAADGSNVQIGAAADANNTFTTRTTLTSTVATTPSSVGLRVRGTSNVATPDTTNDAIQGYTMQAQNAGTLGRNDEVNGIGAAGVASNGTGVYGQSTTGSALAASSGSGAGVYSVSTSGYGVFGQSNSNVGGYFLSSASYGVLGVTTAGGPYSGLTGGATASGAAAFAGGTSNPAAYAAYFTGRTVVNGDFTVVGGQKNAAVQAADGSYRLLHCVEAPEPWFEDFGTASFTNGVASVNLDPDFASVVRTDAYHVFITEIDGFNGLYVTNQTASGFEVRSQNGGNGQFAWRLVAVRKDLKVSRLAKFTLPNIKIPSVDDLKAAGKPTIPTPRPAKGPSGAPPQPQPQPQPRGASSPASQPASQPASPPAPPPAPPPAAPAATGGTQPGPLPPSR